MVMIAFLIYGVSALLTFKDVKLQTSYGQILSLKLYDESNNMVTTLKTLLIESNPLVPIRTTPKLLFTGSLSVRVLFYSPSVINLKLSCAGCEIYTLEIAKIMSSEFDLITLKSNTLKANVNDQIEIDYMDNYKTPFYNLYLLDQEAFGFSVNPSKDYSGKASVTFLKPGVKTLLFYFNDSSFSDIYGIVLNIDAVQYTTIDFTTGNVNFI